jgi:hypothetical protein
MTKTIWGAVVIAIITVNCGNGDMSDKPDEGGARDSGKDGAAISEHASDAATGSSDARRQEEGSAGYPNASALTCGDRFSHRTSGVDSTNTWFGYSCSQRLEDGPERIYTLEVGQTCRAIVRLTGLQADLDLFLLDAACNLQFCPCSVASSTPRDIQTFEAVAIDARARIPYSVVVDGYDRAFGDYDIAADCLCGAITTDFSDGEWQLKIDRRWNRENAQFPTDPLDEKDYDPVSDGPTYSVSISDGWNRVTVGDGDTPVNPFMGELKAGKSGTLDYDLSTGPFGGGRFVVWIAESSLQAEITIYGSGIPIISSERGTLTRGR